MATKCIAKTTNLINLKYRDLLEKPLKRGRLRHLLLDSVYVGRPTLMEATVEDETLRYIDDETYEKCRALLIAERKQEKVSPIAQLVST